MKNIINKIHVTNKYIFELPNLDNLQNDIISIVKNNWSNTEIEKRASYNSKDFNDLYTDINNNKKIYVIGYTNKGNSPSCTSSKTSNTLSNENKEVNTNKNILTNIYYEDKRPLMDMATNFNTKYFWQNKKSRLQFIYLVLYCYQIMLQEIYRITFSKISKNNLNIMFKGGNTFRMVIKELIRNFEGVTEKYILELINEYIKIGDFDFEIISYGLSSNVTAKINNLTYIIMLRLRNYLIKNNIFDFFNYNNEIQFKKILHLKKKLNKLVKTELDQTNWFYDITIDYINVGDMIVGSKIKNKTFNDMIKILNNHYQYRDEDYKWNKLHSSTGKYTKRIDFVIINNGSLKNKRQQCSYVVGLLKARDLLKKWNLTKKEINLTNYSRKDGYFLYCTHNSIVTIENKTNLISFQLNRIKFNYVIYYRKTINGTVYKFKDDIPGEILDLSHSYNEDRKKIKFKQPFNKNKYLQLYSITNFNITFYSYSLIGLLDDIDIIIFDEVDYKPWTETKFKKRLYRAIFLNFFMYFNKKSSITYKEKLDLIKKFIKNIKKNVFTINFKNKELNNMQKKLQKTYNNRNSDLQQYKQYNTLLISILDNIYKIFYTQYFKTRNQILRLDYNNISSRTFSL